LLNGYHKLRLIKEVEELEELNLEYAIDYTRKQNLKIFPIKLVATNPIPIIPIPIIFRLHV
jgi:hypothetical protein